MQRRINVKVLIGLVVGTALLGGGVFLLHRFQVDRNAGLLLDQAKKAESNHDLEKTRVYLVRYLSYRPNDLESLAWYGGVLQKQATTDEQRDQALKVYQRVVARGGQTPELRRELAALAVQLGQFGIARNAVEGLVTPASPGAKLQPSPAEAELRYLLGRCQEAGGRYPEARDLYQQARQQDPTRIEAYVQLANLLRNRLSEADEADRVMDVPKDEDGVVVMNPKAAAAYLARLRYRERFGIGQDTKEAAEAMKADVAKAIELSPDDPEVLLVAASAALRDGNVDKAREYLLHGIELRPETSVFHQTLASVELQAGRVDEAIAALERGIESVSTAPGGGKEFLRWTLADLLIQNDKITDAEKAIGELKKANVRPEFLAFLDARLQMVKGRWSEAARNLESVQSSLASLEGFKELQKRTLLMLGQCYEQMGNLDQRYEAYRKAVAITIDPDFLQAAARYGLATALVDLNRIDEALAEYLKISPPNPSVNLAVARLRIFQNLRRSGDPGQWQDIAQALKALEDQADSKGVSADVALLQAETLAAQNQVVQARELLERMIAKVPDQPALWIALANLAGREKGAEAALAILDRADHQIGAKTELRVAQVGYWARVNGPKAIEALNKFEKEAKGLEPKDRDRILQSLALAYMQLGQRDQATALWKALASSNPDDLKSRLVLFDLAHGGGDDATAQTYLDQIRRIEGSDGVIWRFGRAVLLIANAERNRDERAPLIEARGELQRVELQRPSWSRVSIALARIDELSGNMDSACQRYLKAIMDQGERDPAVLARAVRLLTKQERFADASQVITKLKSEGLPISTGIERLAVQDSLLNGNVTQAMEIARSVIPSDTKDPNELIWLGQVQWAANQPEAEQTFRRAVELARSDSRTWTALVLYLVGVNLRDKAEKEVQNAQKVLPKELIPLFLAQCYEALGHTDQAKEQYEKALAAKPNDMLALRAITTFHIRGRRLAEAQPYLKKIIELGGTRADTDWARNVLATILASQGGYQGSLEALKILDQLPAPEAGQADASKLTDLRTKAKILAMQPSLARRKEAVKILEGLVDRGQALNDDVFLLAQLHDVDGDWSKAQQRYRDLLSSQDKNLVYRTFYLRALIRHEKLDEAQTALESLVKTAPTAPATIEARARVLTAQKKNAEAVELLEDYVKGDDTRLGVTAQLLEELGHYAPAERMYRKYVAKYQDKNPNLLLVLASFLGRHAQTDQALALVDEASKVCTPEAVANTSAVVLYGAPSDSGQFERVAKRLEEAAKANPDKVSILFDLANVRSLQGRYGDAESIYRQVFERNKALGASLNNLAWLLALEGGSKLQEALPTINDAIKLDGETPDLLDTRAVIQLALNQANPAITDLENAIAVSPTFDKYFHLARAYQLAGKSNEAKSALEQAKTLGLALEKLHPLERDSYQQLVRSLGLQ